VGGVPAAGASDVGGSPTGMESAGACAASASDGRSAQCRLRVGVDADTGQIVASEADRQRC
jgi:hypothetical protein